MTKVLKIAGLTLAILLEWLLILVIIPNITLFESSFRPYLPVTEIGGPRDTYSVNNYMKVFNGNIDTSILGELTPSVCAAVVGVSICTFLKGAAWAPVLARESNTKARMRMVVGPCDRWTEFGGR